jgi:hypothetical protein
MPRPGLDKTRTPESIPSTTIPRDSIVTQGKKQASNNNRTAR